MQRGDISVREIIVCMPAPSPPSQPSPETLKHSLPEEVLGFLTGTFLVSFGLFLLQDSETVTGGTAGLSLLLTYATQVPFEVLFIVVNLPFLALAVWKKGWSFTLRTLLAVCLVSALSALHPRAIGSIEIHPVYAALAGNLIIGVGLLVVFRHRGSLGGFNVLALLAQERLGWRAGYVQLSLDLAVVLAAFAVVSPSLVLLSVAGAVVLNIVLAFNHRPGRYLGT